MASPNWPGDGSLEANLAALPPIVGGPTTTVGGIARSVQLGRAGEAAVRAVHNIGVKARIIVNGRVRIPDGLNRIDKVLSEVKNVKRLGFTRQLQDYAKYAADNGFRLISNVRPGAELSPALLEAERASLVNILEIPL